MDIDGETSQERKDFLTQLPDDDFGSVRERRDFGPMDIQLHPILPSPYRDASFSGLTGWRYYPTAHEEDRLCLGDDFEGRPSTEMVIPDSWNDRIIDHSQATPSAKRQLDKLRSWEISKQRRTSLASREHFQNIPMSGDDPVSSSANPASAKDLTDHAPANVNNLKKNAPTKIACLEGATVVTASTASTAASSRTTVSAKTPAGGTATDLVPKQELFFLYQQRPRKVHIKGSDYLTWGNDKVVQDILYTSAFVCPITKEVFLAGSYGGVDVKEGSFYWYSTKKVAEHAAAARAWDCWNVREGRQKQKPMSRETPYFKQDAPELPMYEFPPEIREKVQAFQKEQAKLEEEIKNDPTPPSHRCDDRGNISRGKSKQREHDRCQGGAWNKNGGRGRWDRQSGGYQRYQRYDERAYFTPLQTEQRQGYRLEQNAAVSSYSAGYDSYSDAYNDRRHVAFDHLIEQGTGIHSTGGGDSRHAYSGGSQDASGSHTIRNFGDQNQSSQDYRHAGWQQNRRNSAGGLPHRDETAQDDQGPIRLRRLQEIYNNDDSTYPPPSQNDHSEEW